MSSARPLRERFQSNSPDPELARPTTPLRINKHSSPQPRQGLSPRQGSSRPQIQVARRSSNSFKHVRDNNLVTKSPFRTLIPQALGASPSPRRVSGEKRPRPTSMQASAENEKPLGPKRRQSKSFQGLLQKEPVTKSPFRKPTDSSPPLDDPPPVPPKMKLVSDPPPSAIPVASPHRSVLSDTRRIHGPRSFGERRLPKGKTVTFDEKCDVLEFERDDFIEDVSYDENGYGYGYSYEDGCDEDAEMDESYDSADQVGDDSITGMVDSMLEATRPHTPPRREDEEDADLLPPSPSPAKPHHHAVPEQPLSSASIDSPREYILLLPIPTQYGTVIDARSSVAPVSGSPSQIKDEDPPFEESVRSNDSLDPYNLSIGHSEVSLSNLDSHSLLADADFEGDVLSGASFAPITTSSPRARSVSRSGTPLDRSFERSVDRSFEARSTPALTPSRFNSPRSGSGSPLQKQLFKTASTSSLGSLTGRSPITREMIRERIRKRSEESLGASRSTSSSPAPAQVASKDSDEEEVDPDASRVTEPVSDFPAAMPLMTRQNGTHDGVISIDPEPQPIDPPRPALSERAHSIDVPDIAMDAKRAFAGLELDFEHGFGLGEEGMSVSAGLGIGMGARAKHSSMHLGDVSALDKLMEDMAQGAGVEVNMNTSIVSEGQSYASLHIEETTAGVKAATFSLPAIIRDDGMGIDVDMQSSAYDAPVQTRILESSPASSPPPPPPPAKDAIRAREELIRAKKRETRQQEEDCDSDLEYPGPAMLSPRAAPVVRRRSMSTNDADDLAASRLPPSHRRAASARDDDLLDITALRGEDAPLADTINRELMKRENVKRSRYLVREHTETIYASADAHMDAGGEDTGRAWRTIRRPSDMNEYAKQLRELREHQKSGKAHGKVFVKVVGLRALNVPIPEQPTKVTCTLNNGIHFVTTPETNFGRECTIDQEFELIEHSKLEFTLTIKVRRDPHIVAQFKANQPPASARPPPQPLPPPPASKGGSSKSGGMRSFLGLGSPKKSKLAARAASPAPVAPPPAPAPFTLKENLARYLKPDGSLGRAFISFKDIAAHCDTRLMETTFPLIGQRIEVGSTAKALQIGEIVLHIFRLPPLPGILPDDLPQSLEECHRGLTHTRWHKQCYMQGTLTQLGGDCSTWRRRHLRIVGSNLVAYNDVTKRAIATIDLRKATSLVDLDEVKEARSPGSATTIPTNFDDSNPCDVGRAFRLYFGAEDIAFFADTDQEKADWVSLLKALVGRIPPNPLWAEVLFQRQEQARQVAQAPVSGPSR
ncbi:hypothetical protein C8Q80DRAFT_1267434 [Daedaleopsis nitida]|nr:hypothetical protein C8Q80DRAFT_1267434 [Daedaleopsis nitida]